MIKIVILHASVLPGAREHNGVNINVSDSEALFLALRQRDRLKIIIAAPENGPGIRFRCFSKQRNENFFHEARIEGKNVQEMIRGILADNPSISPVDVLYADTVVYRAEEAKYAGVSACAMVPFGAPAIVTKEVPAHIWPILHPLEIPLIVAAQEPAYS